MPKGPVLERARYVQASRPFSQSLQLISLSSSQHMATHDSKAGTAANKEKNTEMGHTNLKMLDEVCRKWACQRDDTEWKLMAKTQRRLHLKQALFAPSIIFFYTGKWPYTLWCNTNGGNKERARETRTRTDKGREKRTWAGASRMKYTLYARVRVWCVCVCIIYIYIYVYSACKHWDLKQKQGW